MLSRAHSSFYLNFGGLKKPLHAAILLFVPCLVGALLVIKPVSVLTVVFLGAFVGCLLLPPMLWAIAAIAVASFIRGFIALDVLPQAAVFLELPLAWGVLISAILRSFRQSSHRIEELRLFGIFCLVVGMSGLLRTTEFVRVALYLGLVGTPFVIVLGLLMDESSARWNAALRKTLMLIITAELLIGLFQLHLFGIGDPVTGTLPNAHVLGAFCFLAGLWAIGSLQSLSRRLVVAVPLFLMPVLADAKQIIFSVPVGLFLAASRRRTSAVLQGAVLFITVLGLLILPFGQEVFGKLPFGQELFSRASAERVTEVKVQTGVMLWQEIKRDPVSLLVGLGPASTASRSAFITTGLVSENSPVEILDLEPAPFTVRLAEMSRSLYGQTGSSSDIGLSSALGMVGDVGLLGFGSFMVLYATVFLRIRKAGRATPAGFAAACGWGMTLMLGTVYDWWEQPTFLILLACLSGVALTEKKRFTGDVFSSAADIVMPNHT